MSRLVGKQRGAIVSVEDAKAFWSALDPTQALALLRAAPSVAERDRFGGIYGYGRDAHGRPLSVYLGDSATAEEDLVARGWTIVDADRG